MRSMLITNSLMFSLLYSTAFASTIPNDLMYAGKPIDSLCFSNERPHKGTIDLRNCGATHEKYVLNGVNAELSKKEYIGYDWKDPSLPKEANVSGYSYYKFYPANGNMYWIYSINNTGGSGEFTSIFLAQRKDPDTLTIQEVVGGDRCNGGVQNVTEQNHTLTYSVNFTAYDVVNFTNKKLPEVQAYDDLAACATCCVAKGFYTIDKNNHIQFNRLETEKNVKLSELPEQGKYQACFNNLFTTAVAKTAGKFTQEQLNDFTNQFNQVCVNQKQPRH